MKIQSEKIYILGIVKRLWRTHRLLHSFLVFNFKNFYFGKLPIFLGKENFGIYFLSSAQENEMPENGTFLNNTVGKITIFINCFWTEPNRVNVLLDIDKILFSL